MTFEAISVEIVVSGINLHVWALKKVCARSGEEEEIQE